LASVGLPAVIPPLSEKNEKVLVGIIMKELNDNFGLKLDTSPALERGVVTMEKPQTRADCS
jgi:hypothetical protein